MSGRPHQFPTPPPDGEIIAWKCRACDEWVSEFGEYRNDGCPVDWRRKGRLGRRIGLVVDALRGDV